MSGTATTRTLTVRLPSELYLAAQKVAQRRDISLNAFMQASLTDTIRVAEERARYEEYTLLGEDKAMCDTEYAIHAQAEVMLDDKLG